MGDNERSNMYKETQSSILKILEKGLNIDKNIYVNQLVLIKNDITAKNESLRKAALDMLDFLLSLNVEDIQTEVVKILHDGTVNKFVHNCVLKSIKKKIISTISDTRFNFTDVLIPWKNQNINKLTNILEEVCLNDLPKNKRKNFFINHVVPTMMAITTDNEIRNALTDMAFMLSTIVPISDLSNEELNIFLKEVNTKYVKNIGELRDQDYQNWHNLWIFLIRFCDKNIHNSMDLTNRLLRVVEYAFRNPSVQQRLKGYDCWKELIDNASLDMDHMCSPKQIKLLITPLKAKFSKQEIVICKRFDVFTYLLEKLQHKAVLCLTEFLEFCFGPIGDAKDVSKTGQGKSVPEIWRKSTKVLVELIGHSHGKSISCLSTEDVIKLEKPVINYSNICTYHKVIINSIGECCAILKEIDIESKRETVIKCMWKSVFNLVIPTPDGNRIRYFLVISKVLDDYIQQSKENPYFEELLILIFTVLMSYEEEYVYEVIHYILKQLLIIIFTVDNFPAVVADKFKLVVTHAFSKILMVESKLRAVREVMVAFAQLQPNEESVTHISKIWLCVADELITDLTAKQIEDFVEFNDFFMWPAFHLHHLDESTKKQTVLHWMKLYRKISLDSENKKQYVMKDLEKIFKNNPLLSSDVVSLLNVMSQFETKFTKEFVIKLMEVSSLILLLPNLKTDDEQKITAIVMQYFEPSLQCYKCEGNDEVIKNVCNCIKHILCIHKGYKLLDTLANFIKNSPDVLRMKFSEHLSGLLLDLFNKESDVKSYNAKELQKALQVFKVENGDKPGILSPFIPPGGRSARIAKLAKNSPRSPQSKLKKLESSPAALRLFGKDIETLSPLCVKGSQLNNTTPGKSRKIVNTVKRKMTNSPSINDEKSIDFVPIDTEVRFEPEKLSTHQKEVLRKRREDIPALYQDLSQSLSQDMFNSNSSSKGQEKDNNDNSADNRKVIVEVIGHQFKDVFGKEEQKVDIPFIDTPEVIPTASPEPVDDKTVPVIKPEGHSFTETCVEPEKSKQVIKGESDADKSKENNEVAECLNIKNEESTDKKLTELENKEPQGLQNSNEEKHEHEDEKERKIKLKIELQLQKLKMDIVGAEEFLSASSRRTRTREKTKKLAETPGKKSKVISKKETSLQQSQNSRKSLNLEKQEIKIERKRRKTIGVVKDIKNEENSSLNNVTDEGDKSVSLIEIPMRSKSKTVLSSPKTPRRKSSKSKVSEIKAASEVTDQKQSEKREEHPQSAGKNQSDKLDSEDVAENKDKLGQKRKYGSSDFESEDIIESSQETHADVTPVFNRSKKSRKSGLSIKEDLDGSKEKPLVFADVASVFKFAKRRSITEIANEKKLDKSEERTLVQENEEFIPNIEKKLEEIKDTSANFINEEIAHNNAVEETIVSERIEEIPLHIEEVVAEVELTHIADSIDINPIEANFDEAEKQTELNTSQDTTLTQVSTQDLTQDLIQDLTPNVSLDIVQSQDLLEAPNQVTETQNTETQRTETQDSQTQDTPTQSEFCASSEDNRPPVLYFDLPKKPELTESERIMCRMDTMSICSDPSNVTLKNREGDHQSVEELEIEMGSSDVPSEKEKIIDHILATPVSQRSSNIPSSPVTVETPTRNTELLNDTLDISPIYSKNSSSDGAIPECTSVPVSLNFKAEMEELDRIEKEIIPETELEPITEASEGKNEERESQGMNTKDLKENEDIPNLLEDIFKPFEASPNQDEEVLCQVEKVLHQTEDILHKLTEVPHQLEGISQETAQFSWEIEGPPQQNEDIENHIEVIKLAKENNGIHERASKLLNMVNVNSPKIFIKKRAGGISMSPSAARIKRLMSNFNQKQCTEDFGAEVKEEDMLTFTREVPSPLAVPRSSILKRKFSDTSDLEGISPCPKRKRVNFSDPCLTSKKLFIRDDYHQEGLTMEAKCLFEISPETKMKEERPKELFDLPDELAGSEKLTETEDIGTEPSLEVVNSLLLKKDKPIYPKLIDCKEDIMVILKRVTSPIFITTLMNKLRHKDIKTIGDLAKQSEAEVNRFPFKVPVVANVYKALDNYYKKNVEKNGKEGQENVEPGRVNGMEEGENRKHVTQRRIVPTKVKDARTEFKEIVEKSKKEGTIEDQAKILLSCLEKPQLISLAKAQYKMDAKDFIEEKDFRVIIKHINEHVGLPGIFKLLTESIESSEDESVYFDCMIKHSIEKKPLVLLLENRSLDDIKKGLADGIIKNLFTKLDLINNCLLPLIENPSDISSYINSISVVQLGDIVIKRLQAKDLRQFFSQIEKAYDSSEDTMTLLPYKEIEKNLSATSDIVNNFKRCVDAQNEERQHEIMVETFKFISGKLKINTLLELHIDFLKRIPNIANSEEK